LPYPFPWHAFFVTLNLFQGLQLRENIFPSILLLKERNTKRWDCHGHYVPLAKGKERIAQWLIIVPLRVSPLRGCASCSRGNLVFYFYFPFVLTSFQGTFCFSFYRKGAFPTPQWAGIYPSTYIVQISCQNIVIIKDKLSKNALLKSISLVYEKIF